MNELMACPPATGCQAGQRCDRTVCFQARLEASAGGRRVQRHADICGCHLGGTVQALAAWARHQGLTGAVTVAAIDQPTPSAADGLALASSPIPRSLVFGSINLSPPAPARSHRGDGEEWGDVSSGAAS